MYSGQTFLVTGGAGFIGSHVCRMLLEGGARVISVDNYNDFYDPALKEQNTALLKQFGDRFADCRADITDAAALAEIFTRWGSEVSQVVHLAARAGVRPSLANPHLYLDTNVTGTLNILEQMRRVGLRRIVFASSSSVYGNRTDPPFREDQDVSRPVSPYAATKIMAEAIIHTYSALYDIQAVVLRFFTVYGPGQRPDLAIYKFTEAILQGLPIPVYGDGSTERDYTYIDDILKGVAGALRYDRSRFEIFNLGESQAVPLNRLIALLEAALGKTAVLDWQPMQPGDVPMTCADITKAKNLLAYQPTTPIEQGLQKFVAWFGNTRSQFGFIR